MTNTIMMRRYLIIPVVMLGMFMILLLTGFMFKPQTNAESGVHVRTIKTNKSLAVVELDKKETDKGAASHSARESHKDNMVNTNEGQMTFTQKIVMEATAYTAEDGNGDGLTATGMPAKRGERGVVAVDPNFIPLGTKLFIPGYGVAIAADTGGAITGNRIDLLMDSYGEAVHFGRQHVDVYVLPQ